MLALEPLDRGLTTVRGAVVDDPEHAPRRAVRLDAHDLADQPPERLDAGLGLAAPEQPGPVDVPGGEVLEGPAALVLELDPHDPACRRRQGRVTADAGLDARLLIGADHELVVPEPPSFPLARVQVEDARRLGSERRVAREDPAAVGPRLDRVLVEPAPDRRVGDRGHEPAADDLGPDVRDVEPAEGQPEAGRQLTGDRLDGDDERWGGKPADGRSASARRDLPGLPRRSACATSTRPGPGCRAAGRSRCSPGPPRPGARCGPGRATGLTSVRFPNPPLPEALRADAEQLGAVVPGQAD